MGRRLYLEYFPHYLASVSTYPQRITLRIQKADSERSLRELRNGIISNISHWSSQIMSPGYLRSLRRNVSDLSSNICVNAGVQSDRIRVLVCGQDVVSS